MRVAPLERKRSIGSKFHSHLGEKLKRLALSSKHSVALRSVKRTKAKLAFALI